MQVVEIGNHLLVLAALAILPPATARTPAHVARQDHTNRSGDNA